MTMSKPRLDKERFFRDIGYEPHEGQWEIHRSTAPRRIVACGVRWGKTVCAAHEALAAAATRFDSKRSFHRYAHPKVSGAVRDYNRSWVKRLEPLRAVAREAAARHREDSVGEARDAFLAAVKRFESERGIPFRRYAHARVTGAVRDYHRRWMKRLDSLWNAASEAGERLGPLEHEQARTRGRSL